MNQPELYQLEGEKRELGSKVSESLRENLRIPAVLYGPKVEENVHFSISEVELEKILSVSQTKLQTLTVDGEEYKTLLKNVEFDPVTDRALHADFYVLDDETPVKLNVPIRLNGVAIGVRDGGGRVFQPMRIVRIKVMPDKIPAMFELDISDLEIGDSLHVSELDMEGIDPLDDPRRTIVTIAPPKSESLFTTSLVSEEEELAEGEEPEEGEELAEGEEVVEGEAQEGADQSEDKE
ncbi:50S ribosomal protein L25 [Rhodohalobacter sulfatireducens]|uniref:Large ribosomal subunit protein bL25 n=1 Tax=Rhodohalobacter sulfatireducens TaxID=2911366 RepID=A0ABS9K9U0_9BACT|nr:50S ribosomal protein L25 [Rhodohalobacter sulfatireducens]MCG2587572.1 50S ribosomal protein L25 [Rhodohalobacter sulfatireducens]